jgi:S1-C subfamily serine protease
MTRALWILIALAALVSSLASAGGAACEAAAKAEAEKVAKAESKHKCEATTQACLDEMAAHFRGRGWVGVELEIDEETGAMTVTRVEPHSPAADAGFKEGDKLVALNGVRLDDGNKEKMIAAKEKMTVGATVTYTVERAGRSADLSVTLAQIPEAVLAGWIGRHLLEGHAADPSVALAQN